MQKFELSIVIPVWNEVEAVPSVLENVRHGKGWLLSQECRLTDVEVLVVDDGSTDGTAQLLTRSPDITPVLLEHRGYGAALKRGFLEARGSILGFMDGDATGDVKMFADLSRGIIEGTADMVTGNRLHSKSQMPATRYLANRLGGTLLSLLSRRSVRDACSGMRAFSRSLLPLIETLPDDLSFSTAMTARIVFSGHLRAAEVEIDYRERLGRSKLSILRDGWRFGRQVLHELGEARVGARKHSSPALIESQGIQPEFSPPPTE